MNVIHFNLALILMIPTAIMLILGTLGLSLVDDCLINNDCDISSSEDSEIKEMLPLLWFIAFITPIFLLGVLTYFAIFTKFDPEIINDIKKFSRGKKK